MSIRDNLERVREEMAEACARAGREPAAVSLMAVSKIHPAEAVAEAFAAGQRLFGENRVQEYAAKRDALAALLGSSTVAAPAGPPEELRVHLIGPLQNNKTSKAAQLFEAVDSIFELKTAQRLDTAAAALGRILPVLIEVKLSPEATKHGVAPEAVGALLDALRPLEHLRVDGLMTVPPFDEEAEHARPFFRRLRELRDQYREQHPTLQQLSMGMSHDFIVAIEEGSTCVRVGTAIFGARTYA